MSDAGESSEEDITAEPSTGDVGKPAGNNIESNRSGIQTTSQVVELKTKASHASRTSGASTKTTVEIFPQEDFGLLEELRQIPLERLTGRQLEELHGVFYVC